MSIAKNVKLLLQKSPYKQVDLANHLGISTGNLSGILSQNGRYFSVEHIKLIAEFFGVSTDKIYGVDALTENVRVIPMIGNAHCGKPQEYDLNGYEPIPIAESSYKQGMYAVKTEGDSMLPKINDGDILYCIFDSVIDNGDIVHYSLNDESGIRKYKINEAQTVISLVPLNSEYDVITIHHDEHFELRMSKVVGLHREF